MASELEKKMSRLDIRCDHLAGIPGRLPKSTVDSLIQQVREVITEFYAEERRRQEATCTCPPVYRGDHVEHPAVEGCPAHGRGQT